MLDLPVGLLSARLLLTWMNFFPATTSRKQLFQQRTYGVRDCSQQERLAYRRPHVPPHLKLMKAQRLPSPYFPQFLRWDPIGNARRMPPPRVDHREQFRVHLAPHPSPDSPTRMLGEHYRPAFVPSKGL